MWTKLAGIILRNRMVFIISLGLITLFFASQVHKNEVSHDLSKLLPESDSTAYLFKDFREKYGANDNVFIISTEDSTIFSLEKFQQLYDFTYSLENFTAVDSVFGITKFDYLAKDNLNRRFVLKPLFPNRPTKQEEIDSIMNFIQNQPFFENILYVKGKNLAMFAVGLNGDSLLTTKRNSFVLGVANEIERFGKEINVKFRYSGMPYIRSKISSQVESEIYVFLVAAAVLTGLILFFFFRSFTAVFISLIVVGIAVLWSFGIIAVLHFKITILTGLIPPLVIVIGIPNCIFLLNKYFNEFKTHGNQAKSLTRIVQKIGNATLLTNTTTALGFVTFALTPSALLKEFGIVASLSILSVFILSLTIITISYSFFSPPKEKHYKHLEYKWIDKFIDALQNITINYRGTVYVSVIFLAGFAGFGISMLNNDAYIVDDIKESDPVMVDLNYYEKTLNGVVPFEIVISKQKGKVLNIKTLKKIEKLYGLLEHYTEFNRPISILDVVKYSKQTFYNGDVNEYGIPFSNMEFGSISTYARNPENGDDKTLKALISDDKKELRISLQMKDVGSKRTKALMQELKPKINKIFNPDKYNFYFTGISVIVAKGVDLLIKNLVFTLLLAIVLISLIMSFMFRSFRMVIISIVPNILPLVITAAIMGYFGINIKPSTILVFSIAFGISVDDTIHFLAKYRQELSLLNGDIKQAVINALNETGISMFYTSVVLFFGFGVFMVSDFGGTQSLGLLVSITLLIAMLSNLILLPSLLLTLDKLITVKALKDPKEDLFAEQEVEEESEDLKAF